MKHRPKWADHSGVKICVIGGLLGLLTAWVFRHQLFEGWSFPWDFLGTYTTTPAYVADTIGRGHMIAWSPFVASGFPVDVDPQAGVYYPLWWIMGALHIPLTLRVLTAIQVAHVFFGGLGMMALARARHLGWPWAAVAGVAYLFFGGFYGQAEHADYFRGFAYLPWLLWALTPETSGRGYRLAALPPITWLIATGAYPGQLVSFAICGLVYLGVGLRVLDGDAWRQYRRALAFAVVACAALCVAVLLPYLRAEQAGELHRSIEPTAAVRATFALRPLDFFGLYLNNFAWTQEGTITTWAIGVPILTGLAVIRRSSLQRHWSLIISGAVALLLATTPRVGFVGNFMASIRPLFPSRFPAADYKAVVAIALILLSVDAWSHLATSSGRRLWLRMGLAASMLIGGALLVPHTHAQPTRELWLVVLLVVSCAALPMLRKRHYILATVLVALLVVDGAGEINDYRLDGIVSPWQIPRSALAFDIRRDGYIRELPKRLAQIPAVRPARVPAAATAEPNASGWVADAYHETDYDPTVERSLWQAENNPAWSKLLLAPWRAYTFPCSQVKCSAGKVALPAPSGWHISPNVRTLSYGDTKIVYSVNISRPTLMIENELAVRGWRTNSPHVKLLSSRTPLRTWRLAPGDYRFTASFQEPDRTLQEMVAIIALLAWLGCVAVIWLEWPWSFKMVKR